MGRMGWGLIVLCVLATPALAEDPFNVDFSIGWDGCYRPMEWTPVEIGVATTLKDPFGGAVTLASQQDNLTTMTVRHPIVVAKDSPIRIPLVVKLAFGAHSSELTILDDKERARFRQDYSLMNYGGVRTNIALQYSDYLVGAVGRKAFGLAKLPEYGGTSTESRPGRVYVRDKLAKLLPWDWTGYASLDVLILYNPEWDQIGPLQAKAIHQWVSNGGRCLFVLGGRGVPAEGPLAELLPFKPATPQKVVLNERNMPYAGGLKRSATVTAWGLPDKAPQGWSLDKFGSERALLMHGPHGFGKVAVLAFDPSEMPDPQAENSCRFWIQLMGKIQSSDRRITYKPQGGSDNSNSGYSYPYYQTGQSSRATNDVLGHLQDIRELRPLSIWWVILLLALLAVLLGPVDYLVLKKLDRLPLTWVTSAGIIIVFTVGAYFGVQALRAGSMQVRAVTVIDGCQDAAGKPCEVWSTNYCGVFAPASDEYKFEGLAAGQWWSAVSPSREGYYDGYESNIGSRRLFCQQQDGGNLPRSVPINIWSMQCLVSESAMETMPLSAVVSVAGRNSQSLAAKITNNSKAPIMGGFIHAKDGDFRFDRIEPGETKTFRGALGSTRYSAVSFSSSALFGAYGCRQRTAALTEQTMDGKNAMVCVEYEQAPLGYQVVPKDYAVNHVLLARLLVPVTATEDLEF